MAKMVIFKKKHEEIIRSLGAIATTKDEIMRACSTKAAATLRTQRPSDGTPPVISATQTPVQPVSMPIMAIRKSGQPPSIRSLEQKVTAFNTNPETRLLVATVRHNLFKMNIFESGFKERRKAFNSGKSGTTQVNSSASLFTPKTKPSLYYAAPSRSNSPEVYDDWYSIALKHKAPQELCEQLIKLHDKTNTRDESAKAAAQELGRISLEYWKDHPEIIYNCVKFSMGFIVSDRALIQHALPLAGCTENHRQILHLRESGQSGLKIMASPATSPQIINRDKHYTVSGNKALPHGHHETLKALDKHLKKHYGNTPPRINEVLFGAPDDNLKHIVDAFFLDMRSGFEKMDLSIVNLYLYHNRKDILQKLEQIKGFPLLVNYTDQNSGLHKFAYVSLDPEGIPVATETPTHAIESLPDEPAQGPDDKKPRSSLRAWLIKVSGSPIGRLASSISQRFSRLRSHKTA